MQTDSDRREFIAKLIAACGGVAAASTRIKSAAFAADWDTKDRPSYKDYVRRGALKKEVLDVFLHQDSWAQFDPELGYILGNFMPQDGIDNSGTISTVQPDGMRTHQVYRDRPCRINTYGNSFTQCHQVSDGETWQEYLAAHLGEPIRNFGMGGYGVYQAYRRMLREEKTENSAEYLILYMWGDDYFRSVLRCRYLVFYPWWDILGGTMLNGTFWANIEMDLESGRLVEKENLLKTPKELYKMTDADFMYEALKDDLMLQLTLLVAGHISGGFDEAGLQRLSEILRLPRLDFSRADALKPSLAKLRNTYAFAATKYILDKSRRFAAENGKKLLVVHFGPYDAMRTLIESGTRYDQEVVDYLKQNGFRYFDMNEVHVEDFKPFKLSLDDYMRRYFNGHYNPAGNHFFAYSIKGNIVDWLEPKPMPYRTDAQRMIDFREYVTG